MYSEPHRLFRRGTLRDFLDQRLRDLGAAAESLDANRLLSASIDELTDYFVSQYRLEVPRLRRGDAELDHHEAEIDPRLFLPKLIFRNRGDLTFEEVGTPWGFDDVGVSQGMALADLDHDGLASG